MMSAHISSRIIAAALALVFLAPSANAQGSGIVNCFDYYRFGSVKVDVSSSVASAVSGVPISFSGDIINENAYPIVDGVLYARVYMVRGTESGQAADVVDQFTVREHIAIPANGRTPVSFTWDVPADAVTGEYRIATFFTVAKKFNLLGLSFTDDIVGNTVSFVVSGEEGAGSHFVRSSVQVQGQPFFSAAAQPRVGATSTVTVSAEIVNETGEAATVPVTWELYAWDAQDSARKIAQAADQAILAPGETKRVSFTATDTAHPVYYLVGTARYRTTKSIVNVRFVREGVDAPRINFPAVTAFPLEVGKETTVFSCLHNAGESATVPDARLELRLIDERGSLIHEYVYTGEVSGAMMGVADAFTPMRDYDRFSLEAKLYRGDVLVDEARMAYDCDTIAPGSCKPPALDMTAVFYGILAALLALLLLVVVLVLRHRRKKRMLAALADASKKAAPVDVQLFGEKK